MSTHYFVGWSVGSWNCDDAKRKDALVVLHQHDGALEVTGMPLRTNVRSVLVSTHREELIRRLLGVCSVRVQAGLRVTLAVDTPLGWPVAFVDLFTTRRARDVPEAADDNPVLFRTTERALLDRGFRPLSAVRDMIGSPSSKALHFLKRVGFAPVEPGVFRVVSPRTSSVYEAIETIPSIAKRSATLAEAFAPLIADPRIEAVVEDDKHAAQDFTSAVWCALVARRYVTMRDTLYVPEVDVPPNEGWIWIPRDAEPPKKR
ncbi:MAG: hypothetical protein RMA76_35200 [Deltaproteobacteria bacterium]